MTVEEMIQGPESTEIHSSEQMIENLRRYRALKRELEEEKERARAYLEQVRAEIEQDLAPLEEHIERLRESMSRYITVHNGGEKFKVPGLATAYTQKRLSVEIADEEAFAASLDEQSREEVYEKKLSQSRAKKLARVAYEADGEILSGCEVEQSESLGVRLTGGYEGG